MCQNEFFKASEAAVVESVGAFCCWEAVNQKKKPLLPTEESTAEAAVAQTAPSAPTPSRSS